MAYTLFLRDNPDTPSCYDWLLADVAGETHAHGEGAERAEIEARLGELDVSRVQIAGIISAFDVTHCTARIPGRQKRVIHQALPFAVEEQIAQDIDSVHLALGSQSNNEWQVAAIDEPTLQAYMERLEAWEYPVGAIYADAMLLPLDKHQWTILVETEQALIHSRDGAWYAVAVEALSVFVDSLVDSRGSETPPGLQVLATSEAQEKHRMALAALDQNPDALVHMEELTESPLALMARGALAEGAGVINLCQGRFAPADTRQHPLRRWRPVAVVAAIGIVLQLGFMLAEGYYYEQQAHRFNRQAMAIYDDLFPNDTRTHAGNVKRVLTGKLRAAEEGGKGGEFLTLLRYTGHQYQQLTNSESLHFDAIQFSAQRGELRVELRGESFSQLDSMRTGLSNAGLSAQIGSVVNNDDGTRARLTITQGG
ncbi:type II secretion system protein L (GspL) [Halospina denitrificans]|uniref:Type II secretion system protein L n=1 Tax=Halospina denitrificans TaxID=332522 RepID=A0A4R7JWH8_9GAMM|nr:type II secretion system protein GspL [Halospina denitrificans]TDT41369.1 type II secretion system protein L (GspL) [Halospina denitrificans]